MGAIASTGKNVPSFMDNLVEARSGIRRITLWDPSALSVQIAAEVPDYVPTEYFPLKRLDLTSKRRVSSFSLQMDTRLLCQSLQL